MEYFCEICHKQLSGLLGSVHRCALCHKLVCGNCQVGGICKMCRAKMEGKDKKR